MDLIDDLYTQVCRVVNNSTAPLGAKVFIMRDIVRELEGAYDTYLLKERQKEQQASQQQSPIGNSNVTYEKKTIEKPLVEEDKVSPEAWKKWQAFQAQMIEDEKAKETE